MALTEWDELVHRLRADGFEEVPTMRKPGWGWVDAPTFWLFVALAMAWAMVVGSVVYVVLTLSRSG